MKEDEFIFLVKSAANENQFHKFSDKDLNYICQNGSTFKHIAENDTEFRLALSLFQKEISKRKFQHDINMLKIAINEHQLLSGITIAIIVSILTLLFLRYDEQSIQGRLFRFDRLTQTVEVRYHQGSGIYKWDKAHQFKNLQHVRDYMRQIDNLAQMAEIKEKEARKATNYYKESMDEYNKTKQQKDIEDIKDSLDKIRHEQEFNIIHKDR